MKRLKKIDQPRMVSSRIEHDQFKKFEEAMLQQRFLTLQDFIVYAFQLFNDGKIVIEGKDFVLASERNAP